MVFQKKLQLLETENQQVEQEMAYMKTEQRQYHSGKNYQKLRKRVENAEKVIFSCATYFGMFL